MRWQKYKCRIAVGLFCFILVIVLMNKLISERLVTVSRSQTVDYGSKEPDKSISQTAQSCDCPKPKCPKVTTKTDGLIDWSKVITNKEIELGTSTKSYCPKLFEKVDGKKMFSPSYQQAKKKLRNHLKEIMKRNNLTREEDHSGDLVHQQWFYWTLGSHPSVKTVCEIGFNTGHRALIWLESNPKTKLHALNINQSKYISPLVDFFRKTYPGRVQVYYGHSTQTVPKVAAKGEVLCDIAVVDGGRFKDIPFRDIVNMKSLSKKNAILLVDDTGRGAQSTNVVMGAVRKLEKAGYIERIFFCAQKQRGYAAFTYL